MFCTGAIATTLIVEPGKKYPSYRIDGTSVSTEAALNALNDKKVAQGDHLKVYLDDRLTFGDFESVSGLVGKAGFSKPEYLVFKRGASKALQIERVRVVPIDLAAK
jgi:hypothetical protein